MATNLNAIKDLLDSTFLVDHPIKNIMNIWEHAKSFKPKNPADAFSDLNSLKLVGPFNFIERTNKENNDKQGVLVRYRYATDLPEMQTLAIYSAGHFCYWRDAPTDSEPFLIHVSHENEHFPKMDVVGDSNVFCAVHYLLKTVGKSHEDSIKKLMPSDYDPSYYDTVVKNSKKKRSKMSIGRPFHGLGIKVTVKNDIGYRPVTDNLKRLKREIEALGTTDDDILRSKLRDFFLELHSNIQIANDEKDFGMGLEFGHDIFVANYERFDGLAKSVLIQAYRLLDREAFVEILEAQYLAGRRNLENLK